MQAADDQLVESEITAVTVFTDRAEVTREAELALDAGQHVLVFPDLPTRTDAGSLQVDGTGGFTLQDVRFETRFLTELPEGRLKELTEEKEKLDQDLKAIGLDAKRIEANRTALNAVLLRVTTPPKETHEAPPMDAVQWSEMLTFYNVQQEKIDTAKLETDARQQEITRELARVQREIASLNAKSRKESKTAKVVVSLLAAGKVNVELSYIVYGPRWTPSYDIRANTTGKQVAINYYGNITQNTGEDWEKAKVSLSTAQPQIGGREPELTPWFIQEARPQPVDAFFAYDEAAPAPAMARGRMSNMMVANESKVAGSFVESDAVEMVVEEATVQTGATAVVFDIPNPADIPSDNQPVRVAITTQEFPGIYRYSAVPKLSPHTYLKTKVTNTSDFVFLPGQGNIYLDGSFVGKAPLDLVPPGKEFWTWLGIDQGVKVERKLLERKEGEGGFFGGRKNMTFSYLFEIKNDKQEAIELVVWDQLPIPQNEDITVELIEPDSTSDTFKMNEEKFVEWIYQLSPGQELKAPYQFRVSWPEKMDVWGL